MQNEGPMWLAAALSLLARFCGYILQGQIWGCWESPTLYEEWLGVPIAVADSAGLPVIEGGQLSW